MMRTRLTQQEAEARSRQLQVGQYSVHLHLDESELEFRSETVINFSARPNREPTFVDILPSRLHQVVLNQERLDASEHYESGRLMLPNLAASNELYVDATMQFMRSGEGLHRFTDPANDNTYIYSQFELADASRVFAVFDQPDLKSDFRFTVTAPEEWTVISNAMVASISPGSRPGTKMWQFQSVGPISSYLVAIIAGRFHLAGSRDVVGQGQRLIPFNVYCRESLATFADAENILDTAESALHYFEDRFASPYPFDKYDQIFVPEFNAGAMENVGAVTFNDTYIFQSRVSNYLVERRDLTIAHEMAHMWFGNLVTMRWWDDLWLNESFAEYASVCCLSEATSWSDAWTTFSVAEKNWAYWQDQLPTTHPVVAEVRDLSDAETNFDGITYAKGACMIQQLVAWVGRENFDRAIQRYFTLFAGRNATMADLLHEIERTSGRDLETWSRQWLRTTGVDLVEAAFDNSAHAGSTLILRLAGPDAGQLTRAHRVGIGVYRQVGATVSCVEQRDVELTPAQPRVDCPDLHIPKSSFVLVNDRDLTYAKVRLDAESLSVALDLLTEVDDTLVRSQLVGIAWDMTRDCEMPAGVFLDAALRAASVESHPSLLRAVLGNIGTALDQYVNPDHRLEARRDVASVLLELVDRSVPESDAQLQLHRAFVRNASTPEHLDIVASSLVSESGPIGLRIDQEARWDLIIALLASGAADEELVVNELERDPTATGRLRAATALAARPDDSAKALAWRAILHDESMTNAVQAATIEGFKIARTHESVRPFAQEYFEEIGTVWSTRTFEMARQFAVGLFPVFNGTDREIQYCQEALSRTGTNGGPLARYLREGESNLRRALCAQRLDTSWRLSNTRPWDFESGPVKPNDAPTER